MTTLWFGIGHQTDKSLKLTLLLFNPNSTARSNLMWRGWLAYCPLYAYKYTPWCIPRKPDLFQEICLPHKLFMPTWKQGFVVHRKFYSFLN